MKGQLHIRMHVTLPNGEVKVLGYAWDGDSFDPTFRPLPRNREIDPMALHEAMAQRDRRERTAEAISRQLAHAILTAVEEQDTVRGYKRSEINEQL